ncbi:GFA family protein [Novosphingobium olei]|uniref:GFA family protein n=1 Tax=Novosphingobium olei TaxID=2728851 RepID=UPI0030872C21|nr:GFA family protein [Novosphingobium olei]
MGEHTGGCLCGAIRYTIAIDPPIQAVCHCKNCQKQAGSAYSMLVGVPQSAIAITGEPKVYMDKGDSGASVTRQFCGTCGSPLFSLVESAPGLVFVKAGTLDDTTGFKPSAQFWTKSRQDWVDLGALPGFETVPG